MLQNATPLRKSAPWPPNISDEHVFCIAPATRNASLKILFKCPTPAIAFGNATKPSRLAHFWPGAQSTSEGSKVLRTRQFFALLTSKCASRHNGEQFFISHLARWLHPPPFRPSGATNHWKNTVFSRLSYLFDRGYHCLYKSRYHVTPTKGSVRLHFVRITLLCTRFL